MEEAEKGTANATDETLDLVRVLKTLTTIYAIVLSVTTFERFFTCQRIFNKYNPNTLVSAMIP